MKRLGLCLFVWLAVGALAQSPSLQFYCDPTDTAVYLEVSGKSEVFLGLANQDVDLARSNLPGQVTLHFRRKGWRSAQVTVPREALKADHYPPMGSLSLEPGHDLASRGQQALYAVTTCLPWVCIPIILSLVVALGKAALGRRGNRAIGALARRG